MLTVSLETAKSLVANGIVVESYFHWGEFLDSRPELRNKNSLTTYNAYIPIPAPTSDELLEVLPQTIKIEDKYFYLWLRKNKDKSWYVYYLDELYWGKIDPPHRIKLTYQFFAQNLEEAIAKTLLKLKELKLI